MVGLDVTMQVLVEEAQYAEFRKIDTELGRVVNDWLLFYEKLHRNSMGVGGALHDPLGAGADHRPDAASGPARRISASILQAPSPSAPPSPISGRSAACPTMPPSAPRSMPTASSTCSTACSATEPER